MKAFKIFAIVTVVAALTVASIGAIAGKPQKGASPGWIGKSPEHGGTAEAVIEHLQEELELSDDQIAQIRLVLQAHFEQRLDAMKKRGEQMQGNRQSTAQDRQALFQEIQEPLAEILTEEQMQKLRQRGEEQWGNQQEMDSPATQRDFPAHGHFGETLKELNLTVEQKTELFAIAMKYQEMHQEVRKDIMGVRQQAAGTILDLLSNDELNEEQVRQTYREATAQFEEVVVSGAKMLTEMKAVLTPEQLEILQEKGTAFLENMPEDGMFGSKFGFRNRMSGHRPMWGFRFHSSGK